MIGASIARNWSFLMLGRLASLVTSLVFVLYATRALNPAGYGKYTYVITVASYFSFLFEFGLDWVVIQRVAGQQAHAGSYLVNSLLARAAVSVLAVLAACSAARVLGKEDLIPLVLTASLSLFANSIYNAFGSLFQAFERMNLIVMIDIPYSVVRSLAGIAVIGLDLGLFYLLLALFALDMLRALVGGLVYHWKFGFPVSGLSRATFWSLLAAGLPLMFWRLTATVEFRTNVLVLARFWDDATVGWYSAPYRILDLVSLVTLAASAALLPSMSRLYSQSRDRFQEIFGSLLRLGLTAFVPVAMIVSLLAPRLVLILFGEAYLNAVVPLQILSWAALFMAQQNVCGTMLLATGRWSRIPQLGIVTAGTAVAASFWLIPRWGHVGAALTLLLAEAVNFSVTFLFLSRWLDIRPRVASLWRLGIAIALWTPMVWLLRSAPLPIVLICGAAVYCVLIVVLRVVRREELSFLGTLLPAWMIRRLRPAGA